MNNLTTLQIGVQEYCFTLPKCCSHNATQKISICLSFSISGNFIPAAMTDNINYTIDYDKLTNHLQQSIITYDCSSLEDIIKTLKNQIVGFSSLVSGGYLSVSMQCHDAFLSTVDLL